MCACCQLLRCVTSVAKPELRCSPDAVNLLSGQAKAHRLGHPPREVVHVELNALRCQQTRKLAATDLRLVHRRTAIRDMVYCPTITASITRSWARSRIVPDARSMRDRKGPRLPRHSGAGYCLTCPVIVARLLLINRECSACCGACELCEMRR